MSKVKEEVVKEPDPVYIVLEVYLSNKAFESKICLPLLGANSDAIQETIAQFYKMIETALKMGGN